LEPSGRAAESSLPAVRPSNFLVCKLGGIQLRTGTPFTATSQPKRSAEGFYGAWYGNHGPVRRQRAECPGRLSCEHFDPVGISRKSHTPKRINPPPMRCLSWRLLTLLGRSRLQEPQQLQYRRRHRWKSEPGGWRIDRDITGKQKLFGRFSYWNVLDLPIDRCTMGCARIDAWKLLNKRFGRGYNYSISSMTFSTSMPASAIFPIFDLRPMRTSI